MAKKPKQSSTNPRSAPPTAAEISFDSRDAEAGNPFDEFFCPVQDPHGRTARLICKVPPAMADQISRVVQSKRIPFDTASSFMRWAVYIGTVYVEKRMADPEYTSMQATLSAWIAASSVQQTYLHFEEALEVVKRTVKDLLARGAEGPARGIVRDIADKVEKIDDPFWHEKYKNEVVIAYAGLLEAPAKKKGKPK